MVLGTPEVDIVNSLYRQIKKSRGESVHERETSYVKDPLYKSIYNMKKESTRMQMSRQMARHSSQ